MPTLHFYGNNYANCLQCDHWSLYQPPAGDVLTITVYPSLLDKDGVERHIGEGMPYHCVSVLNDDGELVEHITPHHLKPTPA